VRKRSSAILAGRIAAYALAAVAIAILANTVVTYWPGRDKDTGPAAAGTPAQTPAAPVVPTRQASTPALPGTAPPGGTRSSAAAPVVPGAAGQLRLLAGRWLSSAQAKDYFVFKVDGRGAWMVRGRALWKGRATPAGQYNFRLPWQQSTGEQRAAYWQVKLFDGGRKLLFDGTKQVYRKV
jgi:hypothetical protein